MGDSLILEVADHRGRVRSRVRLDRTRPETLVGRAPGNEVVLDDPYADPVHLRITPTDGGGWQFTDLESTNGVWLAAAGIRCRNGAITSGVQLKAGRSILRFIAPDAPVPPALPDPAQRRGIGRRLLEPRTIGAILALGMVTSGFTQYYASTTDVGLADLATPGLSVLILAALWAAAWAFTNRLVAHRFRFLSHWAWAVLMAAIASVVSVGRDWLGFFVPNGHLSWLDIGIWWAGGGLLLVGHFELVTEWPRARRWAVAMAATGALAIVAVVLQRASTGGDGIVAARDGALKPIDARYLPATSLEGFILDAGRLKEKVDEADPDRAAEVSGTRSDSATASARHLHTSGRDPGEPPNRGRVSPETDRPNTPRHHRAAGAPNDD